jgi:hypothetical protein
MGGSDTCGKSNRGPLHGTRPVTFQVPAPAGKWQLTEHPRTTRTGSFMPPLGFLSTAGWCTCHRNIMGQEEAGARAQAGLGRGDALRAAQVDASGVPCSYQAVVTTLLDILRLVQQ